jgi:hypothetical protein
MPLLQNDLSKRQKMAPNKLTESTNQPIYQMIDLLTNPPTNRTINNQGWKQNAAVLYLQRRGWTLLKHLVIRIL